MGKKDHTGREVLCFFFGSIHANRLLPALLESFLAETYRARFFSPQILDIAVYSLHVCIPQRTVCS